MDGGRQPLLSSLSLPPSPLSLAVKRAGGAYAPFSSEDEKLRETHPEEEEDEEEEEEEEGLFKANAVD